jgi:hypothetical protein
MYAGVITGVYHGGVQVSSNGRLRSYDTKRRFSIGERVWFRLDGTGLNISDLQPVCGKTGMDEDGICWESGPCLDEDALLD